MRPKNLANTQEREEHLAKVAEMDRRGYFQSEIAKVMGVSQVSISNDLKVVRSRYKAVQVEDYDAKVNEKLAQYREIRREAWMAWELSKEASVETRDEYVLPYDGDRADDTPGEKRRKHTKEVTRDLLRIKQIVTKSGRLPNNEYLATVLKTLEAERKLLGLDVEQEQTKTSVVIVPWEQLYIPPPVTPSATIEAEIVDLEAKALPPPPSKGANGKPKNNQVE